MEVFNKKDTLTKSISFMALMATINIILSLLGALLPFLYVILIIFLPLTSSLVEVLCKDRYYPIYAFATIGLSIAITFWRFDFTLFYIVPSIVSGYFFGLMVKKHFSPIWAILCGSLVQTAFSFLFVPIIWLLTGRNILTDLATIFSLTGWVEFNDYVLLIFYGLSLVETILSYIAVSSELKKLGFEQEKVMEPGKLIEIILFSTIAVSIGAFFLYKPLSYLFAGLALFFTYFLIQKTVKEKATRKLIIYGVILLLNIFVFAFLCPVLPTGHLLLIEFSPLFIGIISLISI